MTRITLYNSIAAFVGALLIFGCSFASAQLPVTGVHVPELSAFDQLMQDIMQDQSTTAGVLAVSKDGRVVYQRGFGWLDSDHSIPVEPDTPMRLASVEKALTRALIEELADRGDLALDDLVFCVSGASTCGILDIDPYDSQLGDDRLLDVTVRHLVEHRGGWNRGTSFDPQFYAPNIVAALGVPSPPTRYNIVEYMLSQPLQFTPGTNGCTNNQGTPTACYSNFGYMLLGLIVEEITGMTHRDALESSLLTEDTCTAPDYWTGRANRENQDPREPEYVYCNSLVGYVDHCAACNDDSECSGSRECVGGVCRYFTTDLYDPTGPPVEHPYGGFDVESFVGHGNLVSSAGPMLKFLRHYGYVHGGWMGGTSTAIVNHANGVGIVVLFSHSSRSWDVAAAIGDLNIAWPETAVDLWMDLSAVPGGNGTCAVPLGDFNDVEMELAEGGSVHVKPGSATMQVTLSHPMTLDAPLGTVTISGD
jgi:N-acyl-D-amino-acid deacylase